KQQLKEMSEGPGRGGFGGRGGFARSQPGQVLAGPLQERLKLTAEQKKQVAEIQKDVDARLDKLLSDEQKKQLKEMREGLGRGGFGGFGGNARPPDAVYRWHVYCIDRAT